MTFSDRLTRLITEEDGPEMDTSGLKILFLDFDGVLNGDLDRPCDPVPEWAKDWPFTWVSGAIIRELRPLLNVEGFRIVISSTWRKQWRRRDIIRILNEYLPGLGDRVIGHTPILGRARGIEINAWLSAHPNIESYVILDDDSDMLVEQMPRFIKTDGYQGLTSEEVGEIVQLFEKGRG